MAISRTRVVLRTAPANRPAGSSGEIGDGSPTAAEESRSSDDIETEIALDAASGASAGPRIAVGIRADAALDARSSRRPYLLTAHLRF